MRPSTSQGALRQATQHPLILGRNAFSVNPGRPGLDAWRVLVSAACCILQVTTQVPASQNCASYQRLCARRLTRTSRQRLRRKEASFAWHSPITKHHSTLVLTFTFDKASCIKSLAMCVTCDVTVVSWRCVHGRSWRRHATRDQFSEPSLMQSLVCWISILQGVVK